MAKGFAIAAGVSTTALVIAGVLATTILAPSNRFERCNVMAVAGGQLGGPFTLVNHKGETVTDEDILTQPSLVYFGYTFCPDICPLDVVRNVDAIDALADQGKDVKPVFISIDPERDTPEVLADYVFNFGEDMTALTGTPEQVKVASRAYKTFYQRQEGDPDYYLVDHSTQSYFVLPEQGIVQPFGRQIRPDRMAEQMACMMDAL